MSIFLLLLFSYREFNLNLKRKTVKTNNEKPLFKDLHICMLHMLIYSYKCIHLCTNTYVCTYVYVHVCMCECIYLNSHGLLVTDSHTQTHTRMNCVLNKPLELTSLPTKIKDEQKATRNKFYI